MNKADLTLDWCSHEAAKYACEKWHYSGLLPPGKEVRLGVWERGRFVGLVLFRPGPNQNLMKPFGLTPFQGCELARVALAPSHQAPVSRVIAVALRMLHRVSPGLRLVVSFADPVHGHHGGIYQAMGWIYTGTTSPERQFYHDGKWYHWRSFVSSGWSGVSGVDRTGLPMRRTPGKHRYLFPLDPSLRARLLPLTLPYPKRAASVGGDTPGVHPGEGGSTPTAALSPSGHAEAT